MKTKYIDTPAIVQVIGNIFLNPSLLDLEDKYSFNEDDFPNEFHKIVFGSMYNIWHLGGKSLSLETIEDYLSQRPNKKAIYDQNKGGEYILSCKENAQTQSFDYYYQRLKKMSLLRGYESLGMDLNFIYNPNELDVKRQQQQEDWLDNATLIDIVKKIDDKIDNIKLKYADLADEESEQMGEGIEELIEKFRESPEIGYPLFGPYINTITRGARLGKFYLRSAATGVGKALPNSTVIPTPSGDKTVGEIKVGDMLFDAFGKPTYVKAVYPQGEKEVWEVTFKDGRKAKCCSEHLWSFCTEGQRKYSKEARQFYTKTLAEINQMELYQKGHGYKIQVPMQKAVQYPTKQYYIKPYSFGLLLGDGSFRYQPNQKALLYSSEDEFLPSQIANEMNWDYKKNSDLNYNWTFKWKNNSTHPNVWVEEILKDYPALLNAKSEHKFIPKEYLEGDIEQRFDLLNGLLDSDGSVDKEKGRVSYYTISEQLKDNVCKLAQSLGFKTSIVIDSHKATNICYKIEIAGTPKDKIKLFKLPRKKELIMQWFNNGKRKESNDFNPIVSIKKLNYTEEMTCFYVDNKEHLFLMNDFIVTHNTRAMVADACYIGCNQIWDLETESWKSTGVAQPTLYIATEQDITEVQTMCLAFISGVDEEHILTGNYFAGEYERVKLAAQIIKAGSLYFESMPDFSLLDVENTIKKNIRDKGVIYIFFDYMHTSMKVLEEITRRSGGVRLREDNILFMMSIRLKDICVQYNVFILSSTQLNMDYQTSETPDQNLLRGAKSIADKIDTGMIMLEVTQQDREKLAPIIQNRGFAEPVIKISIYKNRRGRWKGIYLWCKANRGICRIEPMFATKYNYEVIELENLMITVN